MNNIYVIIESYIDIDGSTDYTYLGYATTESEAYKCVFDLNEKKRTWKNQAEASCTSYWFEEVKPYNANGTMNKTIEELAKQYASHQTDEQGYGSMEVAIYFDDAKEVLSWLFAKSLRNRLTAEEKDRVRKEYSNTYPLDPDCGVANILIQGVLERIFGKDFFKEDKE